MVTGLSIKKKRKLLGPLGIAILAIIFLFIFTLSSAVYTSRPQFCPTCHYMKPFYESWKESKHSDVPCIQCHFSPGIKSEIRGKLEGLVQVVKYVSLAYKKSKPWAEISDESCLRSGCHEKRLLNGAVLFGKGVRFDHAPHLGELRRGKRLRCTSCHSQIVQGNHMKVTAETCFICHFKSAEGEPPPAIGECTLCHEKQGLLRRSRAGILKYDHRAVVEEGELCSNCHSQTVVGEGTVYKQNCFACHWEEERLAQFENTDLIHKKHIYEHKIECMNCHLAIEHKISFKNIEKSADCGTCHPDQHSAQKILFSGMGGKGVAPQPNKMYEVGLNCRGCHIFHEKGGKKLKGAAFKAKGGSCDSCHGEGYGKILKEWEKKTREKVLLVKKALKRVTRRVERASLPVEKMRELEKLLEKISFNVNVVEEGKGVHNIKYSYELLKAAHRMLKEVIAMGELSLELPDFTEGDVKPHDDCLTCHFDIEKKTPFFAGLNFSHKNHLNRDLSCFQCHSNSRKHGELAIGKTECALCHHHEGVEKGCAQCHKLQADIYKGKWEFAEEANSMISMVDCEGCHGYMGDVKRPGKESCLTCHNEAYGDMLPAWQSETMENLKSIEKMVTYLKINGKGNKEEKLLKKADRFLRGVRSDGSLSAHNPLPLSAAAERIKKELKAIEAKSGENGR